MQWDMKVSCLALGTAVDTVDAGGPYGLEGTFSGPIPSRPIRGVGTRQARGRSIGILNRRWQLGVTYTGRSTRETPGFISEVLMRMLDIDDAVCGRMHERVCVERVPPSRATQAAFHGTLICNLGAHISATKFRGVP